LTGRAGWAIRRVPALGAGRSLKAESNRVNVRVGVDRRPTLDYLASPPSEATQGSLKTKSSVRCKRSSFCINE
jgi:hypothetical protein